MGMTENAARRGLYFTGNNSPDAAAAWVFENIENPELHQPFNPQVTKPDLKALHSKLDESRAYKMVFVVNMSLGMGVGKVAAQVGHATLALYKTLLTDIIQQVNVREWEEKGGAAKVVLKGKDADHLLALKRSADTHMIPSYIIKDAGKLCNCTYQEVTHTT